MAQENKKAILVDVSLQVRVIIPESIDPDVDIDAFNKIVANKVTKRLKEEGPAYLGENIEDFNDDTVNPFDAEHDAD